MAAKSPRIVKNLRQRVETLDVAGGIRNSSRQIQGGANGRLSVIQLGKALFALSFRQLQLKTNAGGGRAAAFTAFVDGVYQAGFGFGKPLRASS